MNNNKPFTVKILIALHCISGILAFLALVSLGNVVSIAGMSPTPVRIAYVLVLVVSIIALALLEFPQKATVTFHIIYALFLIASGMAGTFQQAITGIAIIILICNKRTTKYIEANIKKSSESHDKQRDPTDDK